MVHPLLKVLAVLVSLCLSVEICQAAGGTQQEARSKVFSWLSSQPGFFFNEKLILQQGNIVIEHNVEANEVLMTIPGSAILTASGDEDKSPFCQLYGVLEEEVNLRQTSKYAPYLEQIQMEQESDIGLPSLWSNTGQRLLEIVSLTRPSAKITNVLDDYAHCINDEEQEDAKVGAAIEKDPKTAWGTYKGIKHKNRALSDDKDDIAKNLILALAVKHQIDESYLIPLYDQLIHHQVDYNSIHKVLEDGSVQVVATRAITTGEALYRPSMGCLEDCGEFENANFLEVFKNFGVVQHYPHYWKLEVGMSFIYHGKGEGKGKIEWTEPFDEDMIHGLLKDELEFQRKSYQNEVLPSRGTVDTSEWLAIEGYSQSVISMLEDMLQQHTSKSGSSENESEDDSDDSSDYDSEDEAEGDGKNEEEMAGDIEKVLQDEAPSHFKDRIPYDEQWAVNGCDLSENCGIYDIWDSRNCGSVEGHNSTRNQTEWVLMRSAYVAVVGPSQASIALTYGSGFKVGYKVGHSPGRGRGVFATEDIPKGTLVWTGEYSAKFTDGIQFRKFLSALPDDMVCDLILWCYTYTDSNGQEVIGCDMDEGSLFNSYDDFYEYTVGHGASVKQAGSDDAELESPVYAMRDIKAGEELVTGYDEFDTDNYQAFGL